MSSFPEYQDLTSLGFPDYRMDQDGNVWRQIFNRTNRTRDWQQLAPWTNSQGLLQVCLFKNKRFQIVLVEDLIQQVFGDT